MAWVYMRSTGIYSVPAFLFGVRIVPQISDTVARPEPRSRGVLQQRQSGVRSLQSQEYALRLRAEGCCTSSPVRS